jgi:hypothetical protein
MRRRLGSPAQLLNDRADWWTKVTDLVHVRTDGPGRARGIEDDYGFGTIDEMRERMKGLQRT